MRRRSSRPAFLALTSAGDGPLLVLDLCALLQPPAVGLVSSSSGPRCTSAARWALLCCSSCSSPPGGTRLDQKVPCCFNNQCDVTAAPGWRRDEPREPSPHGPSSCRHPSVAPGDRLPLSSAPTPVRQRREDGDEVGGGGAGRRLLVTFRLLASICLSAAWLVWRLNQRWMVTAARFTCWMNL